MGKGSVSKHRALGNSRAGLRDIPPELAETLQNLVDHPELLEALPEPERRRREEQIGHMQSMRRNRSRASAAGHRVRRAKADSFEGAVRRAADELLPDLRELLAACGGETGYQAQIAACAAGRVIVENALADADSEGYEGDPLELFAVLTLRDAAAAYASILEAADELQHHPELAREARRWRRLLKDSER